MAEMCVPGRTHSASSTGLVDGVAVTRMSALRTTSSAEVISTLMPVCAETFAEKLASLDGLRLAARILVIGRTAHTASISHSACGPSPMTPSTEASGRASRSVAMPLAAAVRIPLR